MMDGVVRSQDPSGWSKVGSSGAVLCEGILPSPRRTVLDRHDLPLERAGWSKLTEEALIAIGYASNYTHWIKARHTCEMDDKKAKSLGDGEAY
jgi:hypothetical protein